MKFTYNYITRYNETLQSKRTNFLTLINTLTKAKSSIMYVETYESLSESKEMPVLNSVSMKKKFVPRANNEIIESGRNISDFQSKNHYRSWRHDHGLKEKVNSELQIGFVTGVALYWIHCNVVTVYVTVACDIFSLIISLSMYHLFICLFFVNSCSKQLEGM